MSDPAVSTGTADSAGTATAQVVLHFGSLPACAIVISNTGGAAITKVKVEHSLDGTTYVEHPVQTAAIGGIDATTGVKCISLSGRVFPYTRLTAYTASSTSVFSVAYMARDAGAFDFAVPGMPSSESAAMGLVAITPSDTVDLTRVTRALWVGVGGDLKVTLVDGTTDELRNIPSGSLLPIAVKRVYATGQTGTLATYVKALY